MRCDAMRGGEVECVKCVGNANGNGMGGTRGRAHALDREERNAKGGKIWQPLTGSRKIGCWGGRLRIIDFWLQPRGMAAVRDGKTRSRLWVAGVARAGLSGAEDSELSSCRPLNVNGAVRCCGWLRRVVAGRSVGSGAGISTTSGSRVEIAAQSQSKAGGYLSGGTQRESRPRDLGFGL